MKKLLMLAVVFGCSISSQASVIIHLSGPTLISDPFTLGPLKSYTVSLEATNTGEKITAVDVRFEGPLWQEAYYKSGFGPKYVPTPMNDLALEGWPAEYIAVDSHFLISSLQAVWPTGKGAGEDLSESYLPRDSYDIWHSQGTFLKSDPMGLSDILQNKTVILAQLVIPSSYEVSSISWMLGSVATNQIPNPQIIPKFLLPEPATIAMLIMGSLLLIRRKV
jgi:hypothetical protein